MEAASRGAVGRSLLIDFFFSLVFHVSVSVDLSVAEPQNEPL